MSYSTYRTHNLAKLAGSHFVAGSGDAASAVVAEAKAEALDDILQEFFQARGETFDGGIIDKKDVKKAIIYARGKKHTKAVRKGVIAGAKFGLQVAATAGGATVGSVVPGLGTAVGGLAGAVGGASLGMLVTVLDRTKRVGKNLYKRYQGTLGEHRGQAAAALMYCSQSRFDWANGRNPADEALIVILQGEYDAVMQARDEKRLASRLKSN